MERKQQRKAEEREILIFSTIYKPINMEKQSIYHFSHEFWVTGKETNNQSGLSDYDFQIQSLYMKCLKVSAVWWDKLLGIYSKSCPCGKGPSCILRWQVVIMECKAQRLRTLRLCKLRPTDHFQIDLILIRTIYIHI